MLQLSPTVGDDAPQINSAIATGDWVQLAPGTYSIQAPIVAPLNPYRLSGAGAQTKLSLDYDGPLFQQANISRIALTDMRLLGNWRPGAVALDLNSVAHSSFERLSFDQFPDAIRLTTTGGQNANFNRFIGLDLANAVNGIYCAGAAGKHVTLNTFESIRWWGATNAVSAGIVFDAYADNNWMRDVYLALSFADSVGLTFNQSDPLNDAEVYENHADNLVVDAFVAGCIAIRSGKLHEPGTKDYPTKIRLRIGGGQTVTLDLGAEDVRLIESNHDGVLVGW